MNIFIWGHNIVSVPISGTSIWMGCWGRWENNFESVSYLIWVTRFLCKTDPLFPNSGLEQLTVVEQLPPTFPQMFLAWQLCSASSSPASQMLLQMIYWGQSSLFPMTSWFLTTSHLIFLKKSFYLFFFRCGFLILSSFLHHFSISSFLKLSRLNTLIPCSSVRVWPRKQNLLCELYMWRF